MSVAKPKCERCGRVIPTSDVKLSSIEFHKSVNSITSLNKIFESKEYLAHFVRNKYRLPKYVDCFLDELEEQIDLIDPENPDRDIANFKIWLFNYTDTTKPEPKRTLLDNDPESPLYEFLRTIYKDGINESFHDFEMTC